MEPADLVARYWNEVWGNGDLDLVGELFAQPYVRHNRNGSKSLSHDDVRRDLVQYWRTLRSPRVQIDDQVVSNDSVWTRLTVRGVNADSGDETPVSFIQVARITGGRIAETWSLNAPDVDWTRPD